MPRFSSTLKMDSALLSALPSALPSRYVSSKRVPLPGKYVATIFSSSLHVSRTGVFSSPTSSHSHQYFAVALSSDRMPRATMDSMAGAFSSGVSASMIAFAGGGSPNALKAGVRTSGWSWKIRCEVSWVDVTMCAS
jgi:hypothetical protein